MSLKGRIERLERTAGRTRNPTLTESQVLSDLHRMAGTIQPPPELGLTAREAVALICPMLADCRNN